MQTSDGRKCRVRYNKMKNPRAHGHMHRNTLATVQEGDYVYFGIARCNLAVDNFRKKYGRELAIKRAEESVKMYVNNTNEPGQLGAFFLSGDGNTGRCYVKYVRTLLKHFESLDQK